MTDSGNPTPGPSSRLAPQARAFFMADEARDQRYRDVAWRAMTAFDMPAVEAIAAQVHPDFFEAPEVLAAGANQPRFILIISTNRLL